MPCYPAAPVITWQGPEEGGLSPEGMRPERGKQGEGNRPMEGPGLGELRSPHLRARELWGGIGSILSIRGTISSGRAPLSSIQGKEASIPSIYLSGGRSFPLGVSGGRLQGCAGTLFVHDFVGWLSFRVGALCRRPRAGARARFTSLAIFVPRRRYDNASCSTYLIREQLSQPLRRP